MLTSVQIVSDLTAGLLQLIEYRGGRLMHMYGYVGGVC